MRVLALPTCFLLMAAPALRAQAAPTYGKPAAPAWGPAPAAFPKGATMAVVSGDPSKAAPFTIELAMPDGYVIPPHYHPTDETVTVKKGTLLVGMGDTFDASKAKPMKAGETGSLPKNAHHFASAKGATVISVTAMGPFGMTYVNPGDDPQKPMAKP